MVTNGVHDGHVSVRVIVVLHQSLHGVKAGDQHLRRVLLIRRHRSVLRHITTLPLSLAATTAGSVLNTLALADGNCGLGVGGCGTHALLDLAGHGKESLLDVGGALCGGLKEGNAEAVCELLFALLDGLRLLVLVT